MNYFPVCRHSVKWKLKYFLWIFKHFFIKEYSRKNIKIFEKNLKSIFEKDIIAVNSFRSVFSATLRYLKQHGKSKILFPETYFLPLLKTAELEGFTVEFYKETDNIKRFIFSLNKKINEFSPDIILLSHHYGKEFTFSEEMKKLCRENNIVILEDMAHSFGLKKCAGNFSFLSFGTGKDLCGPGGGAVLFDKSEFADFENYIKSDLIINNNELKDFLPSLAEIIFSSFPLFQLAVFPAIFLLCIFNYRKYSEIFNKIDSYVDNKNKKISAFQAKILNNQLINYQNNLDLRIEFGKIYSRRLKNIIPNNTWLCACYKCRNEKHRDELIKFLIKRGIDVRFDYLCHKKITQNHIIYLPSHHQLTLKQVKKICSIINLFESRKKYNISD